MLPKESPLFNDDDESELETPSTIGVHVQIPSKQVLLPNPPLPRTTLAETIQRLFPVGSPTVLSVPESLLGSPTTTVPSTTMVRISHLAESLNKKRNLMDQSSIADESSIQSPEATEFQSAQSSPLNENIVQTKYHCKHFCHQPQLLIMSTLIAL